VAARVSVVIPCFNLGQYLREALASVEAQTVPPDEVVVIDDGSTDPATKEVLAGLGGPRLHVISIPNAGVGAARNLGARSTTGDYVCFLDADDRLAPGYLEATARALEENAGLGFAATWLQTFGSATWDWKETSCALEALLFGNIGAATVMVRRSDFEAVGGYDTQMPHQGYEDWDLLLALTTRGRGGVLIERVLSFYRLRPGSMASHCCVGTAHTDLMQYLYKKYQQAYQQHFLAVAEQKLARDLSPMWKAAQGKRRKARALATLPLWRARAPGLRLSALLLLDVLREALREPPPRG
jgi:glycosyltransferase involved in cell wall biosynthesis